MPISTRSKLNGIPNTVYVLLEPIWTSRAHSRHAQVSQQVVICSPRRTGAGGWKRAPISEFTPPRSRETPGDGGQGSGRRLHPSGRLRHDEAMRTRYFNLRFGHGLAGVLMASAVALGQTPKPDNVQGETSETAASSPAPPGTAESSPDSARVDALFDSRNLVAWCIVPFDGKKRGPAARAAMLERLGLRRCAYDWRGEHVASFEEEILEYKKRGIEYFAFWSEHEAAFELFKKHGLTPQIWRIPASPKAETQQQRIELAAKELLPLVERTRALGSRLGLYNHGGWSGEPGNLVAVCRYLRREHDADHVGIVYNLHHGHGHIDDFAQVLALLRPYLLCLNLNGMNSGARPKILQLGQGEHDLELLQAIARSGYDGPIGILGHTQDDVELRLRDNLDGLEWLVPQLKGYPAEAQPVPRTPTGLPAKAAKGPNVGDPWEVEDDAARAALPEFKTTPAASSSELTAANGSPTLDSLRRWTRSHGGDESLRYSALSSIDRENVQKLEVAWTYRSEDGRGNIQCNPIAVNGVLYAPTVGHHLVAIDGSTGRELWRFKPDRRPAFRGLTYWSGGDGLDARLFFATEGRRLYAIDPKNGQPVLAFGGKGWVSLTEGARVAPAIFERTIVIAGYLRDVEAFDVVTGEFRWRFHTVPRAGEYGFDTWSKTPANAANCWGGMSLDPVRGIAYITTGSPKPNFRGMEHVGDNLFANCLVAIDVRNGQRLWHVQEIPHDIWDLDLPAAPVLTTIQRHNKKIDVVAAVSKTGNTLLVDRVSGKPIFPLRRRRAPVSEVPGERTAPYQMDLELPEPFARQVFDPEEIPNYSLDVFLWATAQYKSLRHGWFLPVSDRKVTAFYGVHGGAEWTGACADPTTGRLYVTANEVPWLMSLVNVDEPQRPPNAPPTAGQRLYEKHCQECHGKDRTGVGVAPPLIGLKHRTDDRGVVELLKTGRGSMPVFPPFADADEKALLDYLFVRDIDGEADLKRPSRPQYVQNKWQRFLDPEGYPAVKPPWGTLNCLDLNSGKLLWKVPLGEHEALTKRGVPVTGTENFGGASVTAGGVVFAAGTRDEKIRAFDAESGHELWSYKLPFGGYAPPTIYEAEGRQFVVVAATGGGKLGGPTGDAYVAFALPAE